MPQTRVADIYTWLFQIWSDQHTCKDTAWGNQSKEVVTLIEGSFLVLNP